MQSAFKRSLWSSSAPKLQVATRITQAGAINWQDILRPGNEFFCDGPDIGEENNGKKFQ